MFASWKFLAAKASEKLASLSQQSTLQNCPPISYSRTRVELCLNFRPKFSFKPSRTHIPTNSKISSLLLIKELASNVGYTKTIYSTSGTRVLRKSMIVFMPLAEETRFVSLSFQKFWTKTRSVRKNLPRWTTTWVNSRLPCTSKLSCWQEGGTLQDRPQPKQLPMISRVILGLKSPLLKKLVSTTEAYASATRYMSFVALTALKNSTQSKVST